MIKKKLWIALFILIALIAIAYFALFSVKKGTNLPWKTVAAPFGDEIAVRLYETDSFYTIKDSSVIEDINHLLGQYTLSFESRNWENDGGALVIKGEGYELDFHGNTLVYVGPFLKFAVYKIEGPGNLSEELLDYLEQNLPAE